MFGMLRFCLLLVGRQGQIMNEGVNAVRVNERIGKWLEIHLSPPKNLQHGLAAFEQDLRVDDLERKAEIACQMPGVVE